MDSLKLHGSFNFLVKDKEGKTKINKTIDNLVVTAGLGEITNLIGNVSSPSAFTYIAVGTSSTAVATAQTTLGVELASSGLTRASATVSQETSTLTNDTLQLLKTFTVTGSQTIEEVGVFNASSGGDMLCRAVTGSISVVNGDELTIRYKIVFADA